MMDEPASVAAHRHYLRCAEAFAAARGSEASAKARDELTKAQRAYWATLDTEDVSEFLAREISSLFGE